MVRVRIKLVEEPLLQTTFPNSNHSESYFTLAKSTRRRWRLCCSPKLIPQIWLQFFFFCENRQAINTSTRWNDKIFSSIENLISSNAFTIPSNLNSETMKQYKGLTIEIILACKLSKIISAHLVNDFCSIESLWLLSSSPSILRTAVWVWIEIHVLEQNFSHVHGVLFTWNQDFLR